MPEDRRRELRNCDTMSNPAYPTRCPWAVLTPQAEALADAFVTYQAHGVLPYPGTLRDQPGYVGEAIMVCANDLPGLRSKP